MYHGGSTEKQKLIEDRIFCWFISEILNLTTKDGNEDSQTRLSLKILRH